MPEENKLKNIAIYAVISIALCFGIYYFVYKPLIKDINSLKSSLNLINSEIKTMEGGTLLLKNVPEARASIKKELDVLSIKMPSETDAPYIVNKFISIVGKGLNIDYNLIQPSAIVSEKNYRRLPLNVEFEGDYANLNTYLSQLKNLPVAIRVDNMELHKQGATSKLGIKLGLSAFMMPGGPVEPAAAPIQKPFAYNYLDPFFVTSERTQETKAAPIQGLRYSGYWRGAQMKAIINDEIYSLGQTVQGYRVVGIYRDRVVMQKSGRLFNLMLGGNK